MSQRSSLWFKRAIHICVVPRSREGSDQPETTRPGSTYQVSKLTLHISRTASLPSANLVVSLGTTHAGGAVPGSTVSIPPSAITDASSGSSYQIVDVVFAAPVTLNAGTIYYINVVSATSGGRPYYVEIHAANSYANGAFTGAGGGSRDMWFQVWGS